MSNNRTPSGFGMTSSLASCLPQSSIAGVSKAFGSTFSTTTSFVFKSAAPSTNTFVFGATSSLPFTFSVEEEDSQSEGGDIESEDEGDMEVEVIEGRTLEEQHERMKKELTFMGGGERVGLPGERMLGVVPELPKTDIEEYRLSKETKEGSTRSSLEFEKQSKEENGSKSPGAAPELKEAPAASHQPKPAKEEEKSKSPPTGPPAQLKLSRRQKRASKQQQQQQVQALAPPKKPTAPVPALAPIFTAPKPETRSISPPANAGPQLQVPKKRNKKAFRTASTRIFSKPRARPKEQGPVVVGEKASPIPVITMTAVNDARKPSSRQQKKSKVPALLTVPNVDTPRKVSSQQHGHPQNQNNAAAHLAAAKAVPTTTTTTAAQPKAPPIIPPNALQGNEDWNLQLKQRSFSMNAAVMSRMPLAEVVKNGRSMFIPLKEEDLPTPTEVPRPKLTPVKPSITTRKPSSAARKVSKAATPKSVQIAVPPSPKKTIPPQTVLQPVAKEETKDAPKDDGMSAYLYNRMLDSEIFRRNVILREVIRLIQDVLESYTAGTVGGHGSGGQGHLGTLRTGGSVFNNHTRQIIDILSYSPRHTATVRRKTSGDTLGGGNSTVDTNPFEYVPPASKPPTGPVAKRRQQTDCYRPGMKRARSPEPAPSKRCRTTTTFNAPVAIPVVPEQSPEEYVTNLMLRCTLEPTPPSHQRIPSLNIPRGPVLTLDPLKTVMYRRQIVNDAIHLVSVSEVVSTVFFARSVLDRPPPFSTDRSYSFIIGRKDELDMLERVIKFVMNVQSFETVDLGCWENRRPGGFNDFVRKVQFEVVGAGRQHSQQQQQQHQHQQPVMGMEYFGQGVPAPLGYWMPQQPPPPPPPQGSYPGCEGIGSWY